MVVGPPGPGGVRPTRQGDRVVPRGWSRIKRPCGRCSGCRLQIAQDFAVRGWLETTQHESSSFLTLTYDPESCPDRVSSRHLKTFWNAMRRDGLPVRYLACAEYGTRTLRPHYHAILFGYVPPLKERTSSLSSYGSERFNKLWPHGFHQFDPVTPASVAYVARYVAKKSTPLLGRTDERRYLSRGIGISGLNYINDLVNDRLQVSEGRTERTPRYLVQKLEAHHAALLKCNREASALARIPWTQSITRPSFDDIAESHRRAHAREAINSHRISLCAGTL